MMRRAIPVTSVARTLLDLSAVVNPLQVEVALESALRARLTTIAKLEDVLHRSGRTVAGRALLAALLDRPKTATESALEAIVWRELTRGGLPEPVRQHRILDQTGRFVARVDFAYPDALLAIEADGFRFHSSRGDWQRDRNRHNALTRLGWIIYRVTWEDATERPSRMIDEVAALLTARRRSVPAPSEEV